MLIWVQKNRVLAEADQIQSQVSGNQKQQETLKAENERLNDCLSAEIEELSKNIVSSRIIMN